MLGELLIDLEEEFSITFYVKLTEHEEGSLRIDSVWVGIGYFSEENPTHYPERNRSSFDGNVFNIYVVGFYSNGIGNARDKIVNADMKCCINMNYNEYLKANAIVGSYQSKPNITDYLCKEALTKIAQAINLETPSIKWNINPSEWLNYLINTNPTRIKDCF